MTNSPVVSVVSILTVNPSCFLFHILSNTISFLGMEDVNLFSSVSVMGRSIHCFVTAFSRVCAEYWVQVEDFWTRTEQMLETSGLRNSSSGSVQIVRRFFSPLMEMNHHFEDVRRPIPVWMMTQISSCISGNVSIDVTSGIPVVFLGMSRQKLTKPVPDRSSNQEVQSHTRVVEHHTESWSNQPLPKYLLWINKSKPRRLYFIMNQESES